MAEARNWVITTQRMAPAPTVRADAPWLAHGETDEKPAPAPSAARMSESAAPAAAPPSMAAHDTADEDASLVPDASITLGRGSPGVDEIAAAIGFPQVWVDCQGLAIVNISTFRILFYPIAKAPMNGPSKARSESRSE